jgi:hypothetical protein
LEVQNPQTIAATCDHGDSAQDKNNVMAGDNMKKHEENLKLFANEWEDKAERRSIELPVDLRESDIQSLFVLERAR